MKDNLKKIKKLDMGFISGSMEDYTRGTGTKESSTDSESYSMIKNYLSWGMACGKMEKGFPYLPKNRKLILFNPFSMITMILKNKKAFNL